VVTRTTVCAVLALSNVRAGLSFMQHLVDFFPPADPPRAGSHLPLGSTPPEASLSPQPFPRPELPRATVLVREEPESDSPRNAYCPHSNLEVAGEAAGRQGACSVDRKKEAPLETWRAEGGLLIHGHAVWEPLQLDR
jgi:hypothetical protein